VAIHQVVLDAAVEAFAWQPVPLLMQHAARHGFASAAPLWGSAVSPRPTRVSRVIEPCTKARLRCSPRAE
jgi:hypothetical protein